MKTSTLKPQEGLRQAEILVPHFKSSQLSNYDVSFICWNLIENHGRFKAGGS